MLTAISATPLLGVKAASKSTQNSISVMKDSFPWRACESDHYTCKLPHSHADPSHRTFVDNGSILTFYWRPRDGRARLLFTAIDSRGQETFYCTPLNCLRAIRDDSILQLCMARSHEDRAFWPWADLKFIYHERMVLFYSTFVALKRQDLAIVPEPLIEDPRDMEEEVLFSGITRDREMYHALRMLRDPGSGVLRLEARSYRGDKEEVPIWTAFLSKYRDARDRDIFNLEGNGIVSMICPKPKPYIFVQEYGIPCMSNGDFALQFSKRDGELTVLLLNLVYIHRLDADDLLFCRCQTFD
jgi:hypothetical protein